MFENICKMYAPLFLCTGHNFLKSRNFKENFICVTVLTYNYTFIMWSPSRNTKTSHLQVLHVNYHSISVLLNTVTTWWLKNDSSLCCQMLAAQWLHCHWQLSHHAANRYQQWLHCQWPVTSSHWNREFCCVVLPSITCIICWVHLTANYCNSINSSCHFPYLTYGIKYMSFLKTFAVIKLLLNILMGQFEWL